MAKPMVPGVLEILRTQCGISPHKDRRQLNTLKREGSYLPKHGPRRNHWLYWGTPNRLEITMFCSHLGDASLERRLLTLDTSTLDQQSMWERNSAECRHLVRKTTFRSLCRHLTASHECDESTCQTDGVPAIKTTAEIC